MTTILFVEDDQTIAMGVRYSLTREGFEMTLAHRLNEARMLLKNQRFDLVLLDLGLPDGSGFTLCKEIRSAGDTPIIILSARDEEVNVVMGLDLGADDYVTKPFRLGELVSRIHAVLRRRAPETGENRTLEWGGVKIIANQARVFKNDQEITLTAVEYRLLLALLTHPGQVLSR
ncbi:MAG: response regulator transcription factor, partial [Anaerolineaceae bacterium]